MAPQASSAGDVQGHRHHRRSGHICKGLCQKRVQESAIALGGRPLPDSEGILHNMQGLFQRRFFDYVDFQRMCHVIGSVFGSKRQLLRTCRGIVSGAAEECQPFSALTPRENTTAQCSLVLKCSLFTSDALLSHVGLC